MTLRRWTDLRWALLALAGLALVTAAAMVIDRVIHSAAAAGWLYLLVVLPVTLRWGRGAGIAVAALAGLLLLGFLTSPRFSLDITDRRDEARVALSIGGMILAVLLVDSANRGRIRAERRLAAQEEGEHLQQLSLAGIAHDLSQPLTAVLLSAQMLERGFERMSAERRAQTLADLERSAERLRRLINDWLTLARGEGEPDLDIRQLAPLPLMEETARRQGGRFEGGLTVQHPAELPPILADESATERVLDNLLINAAKYGAGPVTLAAEPDGNAVRFSVLDHGPGLAPGELETIFRPFYRSEAAKERASGYGLGLAITAMLVRAQGGRIWAENRPGGGAAFHFTVPIAPDPPQTRDETPRADDVEAPR